MGRNLLDRIDVMVNKENETNVENVGNEVNMENMEIAGVEETEIV
jgi:hypothetical protein